MGLKGKNEFEGIEDDRKISLVGPKPKIDHTTHRVTIEKSTFRTDLELRALQWELPPHFLPLCRKAVNTYLGGRWKEAKVLLEVTTKMTPYERQGPTGHVLDFIKSYNYECPKTWNGYRVLDV